MNIFMVAAAVCLLIGAGVLGVICAQLEKKFREEKRDGRHIK